MSEISSNEDSKKLSKQNVRKPTKSILYASSVRALIWQQNHALST